MAVISAGTYTGVAQRGATEPLQETNFGASTPVRGANSGQGNRLARVPLMTESALAQPAAFKPVVSEERPPALGQAPGLRAVNAVIGENLGQDNYIVHCYPPASGQFDIRLPGVLIPKELRAFGRPVYVAIEVEGGIRKPVITPREITNPLPRLPEQDAIERWLDTLEC